MEPAVLLAALSALLYGGADFLGGLATRRGTAAAVVSLVEIAGLGLFAAIVPFVSLGTPTRAELLWGGASGAAGGAGLALLFRALALGPMSIAAPVAAITAAALPVAIGVLAGERPGVRALAGIAAAIGAIALATRPADPRGARPPVPTLALAFGAGVAFAIFYVALGRTSPASGLWPAVAGRAVTLAMFAPVVILQRRRRDVLARDGLVPALACGVLDTLAHVSYTLAAQRGLLSIVAPIGSMYPAGTIALAALLLGERLTATQIAGLACGAVAILLLA